MKKRIYNVLIVVFAVIFLVSAGCLVRYYYQAHETKSEMDELREMKEESKSQNNDHKAEQVDELPDFTKLKNKNSDIAGWIQIQGTGIDYPLMQTPKEEQYYLHRNFQKKYDANGLPFLSGEADVDDGESNLYIYGHHMKSGMMFAPLLKYKDKAYYKKHSLIHIDFLNQRKDYEIVAAFYSKIYAKKDGAFKFYQYKGHMEEDTYTDYIKGIEQNCLYETGVKPVYGKQLITLVTCSYHTDDGRFVVVAQETGGTI